MISRFQIRAAKGSYFVGDIDHHAKWMGGGCGRNIPDEVKKKKDNAKHLRDNFVLEPTEEQYRHFVDCGQCGFARPDLMAE